MVQLFGKGQNDIFDGFVGFLYSSNYDGGTFTAYKVDKETGEILEGNYFTREFGPGTDLMTLSDF